MRAFGKNRYQAYSVRHTFFAFFVCVCFRLLEHRQQTAIDDEQGVFAVSGTKTVRCASVVENKPARIIVLLDANVPAGDFTLEVRTKLTSDGSKKSKTLKKGYYRKTLKAVV